MSKGKFKKRFIVIPLLVLLVGGGAFGAVKLLQGKNTVNVAPVSDAVAEAKMYTLDEMGDTYYGKLVKGSVASIKTNPELKIESVKVKKGDSVKKGDLILAYDVHSLEDNVADAELMVKTLTNEITILQNEIDILTRIQPSENKPEDEEPEEEETKDEAAPGVAFEKKLTPKSVPLGGSGTAEDPLIYIAGEDTVISSQLLEQLEKSSGAAAVYVCDETGAQLYARFIDGSQIAGYRKDLPVSDGVTVTPGGMIAYSGGTVGFAAFVTAGAAQSGADMPQGYEMPEMPEMPELPDTDMSSYELSLNDNYMYSLRELKDMISQREKDIASKELEKRQAELNVKRSKKLAETGGETAQIDGKVTFVAKDIYHLPENGSYVTIANEDGMSVSSSVGEFSRDKISVGMEADITNFETGAVTKGVVTELSDKPSEQGGSDDSQGSALESQYAFTVTLNDEMEISEDSEVQISFPREGAENAIIVPAPLVRSEAGRCFMMIANNETNRLEKRYVTIGEVSATSVEILDGITEDDRFAFPYGKSVEGVRVVDSTFEKTYYDYGIIF